MNNFIKKLQKKPERERQRILLTSTVVITLIIFAFWIASFHNVLVKNSENAKTVETSPFTVLKSNLGSAYESVAALLHGSTIKSQ
jgi:hypothetical protein